MCHEYRIGVRLLCVLLVVMLKQRVLSREGRPTNLALEFRFGAHLDPASE